jgi:hypothetical protein
MGVFCQWFLRDNFVDYVFVQRPKLRAIIRNRSRKSRLTPPTQAHTDPQAVFGRVRARSRIRPGDEVADISLPPKKVQLFRLLPREGHFSCASLPKNEPTAAEPFLFKFF